MAVTIKYLWYTTTALGLLILLAGIPQSGAQAQDDRHCFPETGFCIAGRIRAFWEQNGGLPVFGFPIAPQQEQVIEGQPFQVQWFERNRLELHPENAPPYDVLLGRLGALPKVCGAAAPAPPELPCVGIWVAPEQLARLPTDGPAWNRLEAIAAGDLGKANIADQDSTHDVRTLAVALVYARTGDTSYRGKAADAIMAAIGTEAGGRTLARGRNLLS